VAAQAAAAEAVGVAAAAAETAMEEQPAAVAAVGGSDAAGASSLQVLELPVPEAIASPRNALDKEVQGQLWRNRCAGSAAAA
jgi:hypothetical protein